MTRPQWLNYSVASVPDRAIIAHLNHRKELADHTVGRAIICHSCECIFVTRYSEKEYKKFFKKYKSDITIMSHPGVKKDPSIEELEALIRQYPEKKKRKKKK